MSSPTERVIVHVIGARPNVMKLGPLYHAIKKLENVRQVVVHSGQHYDAPLVAELFEDFDLPVADHNLSVGSFSPAQQFGEVIIRLSKILEEDPADMVITYGDVRTTPAAAIAGHHTGAAVVHYEGGLRAFNRVWSEEFHRISADAYSDLLFPTEEAARDNAIKERQSDEDVYLEGDLLCDAVRMLVERGDIEKLKKQYALEDEFIVMTAHHASNVDREETLTKIIDVVELVAQRKSVVYPVHPRPMSKLKEYGLLDRLESIKGVTHLPPLRYAEFILLVNASPVVVTDSGSLGIECQYLKKPMLFLHNHTERPGTVESGAVVVTGLDLKKVETELDRALTSGFEITCPDFLDGYSAERIAKRIDTYLRKRASTS